MIAATAGGEERAILSQRRWGLLRGKLQMALGSLEAFDRPANLPFYSQSHGLDHGLQAVLCILGPSDDVLRRFSVRGI